MTPTTEYSLGASDLLSCPPLAALAAQGMVASGCSSPLLHLDCSALPYQRTLGVCHQVSELLLLRQAGFSLRLHRADPALRRCLQLLQVADLFTWVA